MIDPLLSLAFAIHSNKGVYAILLGSGVSRSAGIPTGWEVVLDLSRKLAAMMSEDCGDDPAAWYQLKFGKQPNYSELLDALCHTPTERQQLLRSYFEPDEDERAQGLKQPTKAHRAVARLMAQGFVRVVLTTNFDKLLERAIEEEGLSPVVISTSDAIAGAIPLVHQRCCVVKLHGDYLDTRIRNTPAELARYDSGMDKLLDQVLDEFGLIVCGWSGQTDVALRAAIERCPSRRFACFWAAHAKLTLEAQKLLAFRGGAVIHITDADSFFAKLADLIEGLEQSESPHPSSITALAAITKRYLADPKLTIRLSDLVHEETEAAHKHVEAVSDRILQQNNVDLARAFGEYRAAVARLQTVLVHGCAFGRVEHESLWVGALERLSRTKRQGYTLNETIRLYPVIVLWYSAGLAALATDRVSTLAALLTRPARKDSNGKLRPLILGSFWGDLYRTCTLLPGFERKWFPCSQHLLVVLTEPLARYLPDQDSFDRRFDEFEYLLALTHLDLQTSPSSPSWTPTGQFSWKAKYDDSSILHTAASELEAQQDAWPPLRAGLFGSNPERAKALQERLKDFVSKLNFYGAAAPHVAQLIGFPDRPH